MEGIATGIQKQMNTENEQVEKAEGSTVTSPVVAKPSLGEKTLKSVGKLWTVVSADMRLRALLGAGITAAFAFLGLHVDGETALSMVTAGALLAGIGPHQKSGE